MWLLTLSTYRPWVWRDPVESLDTPAMPAMVVDVDVLRRPLLKEG